ncbi:hypothetical protein AVEN_242053-1, partial [Araneus ventricosus]
PQCPSELRFGVAEEHETEEEGWKVEGNREEGWSCSSTTLFRNWQTDVRFTNDSSLRSGWLKEIFL